MEVYLSPLKCSLYALLILSVACYMFKHILSHCHSYSNICLTGPPSKRSIKPPSTRTISRQRPYKDPYMPVSHEDYDQMDRESVVSAWSMGDDVRHILYDDAASSIVSYIFLLYNDYRLAHNNCAIGCMFLGSLCKSTGRYF